MQSGFQMYSCDPFRFSSREAKNRHLPWKVESGGDIPSAGDIGALAPQESP
jgi:hypothetical protein